MVTLSLAAPAPEQYNSSIKAVHSAETLPEKYPAQPAHRQVSLSYKTTFINFNIYTKELSTILLD